jgi:hypothetical protein
MQKRMIEIIREEVKAKKLAKADAKTLKRNNAKEARKAERVAKPLKQKQCQHCNFSQNPNKRFCISCGFYTGFWSTDVYRRNAK